MSRSPQQTLIRRQLDAKLNPLRTAAAHMAPPSKGWLRALRKALGLTIPQLAKRARLHRNSVAGVEQREATGTLTIDTLRRVADGMECDLVYFLIPRRPLSEMVELRAYAHAQRLMHAVAHSMALEDQAVNAEEREAQVRDLAEKLVRETDGRIWDDP